MRDLSSPDRKRGRGVSADAFGVPVSASDGGGEAVTALTPPGLAWVDELPPPDPPAQPLPHDEWAAAMRKNPHRWARLEPLPRNRANLVSGARGAAPYRPAGSFQTEIRGGLVHARYVGVYEVIR